MSQIYWKLLRSAVCIFRHPAFVYAVLILVMTRLFINAVKCHHSCLVSCAFKSCFALHGYEPINSGLEYFDDTHAFDLATGSWTSLETVGDRPSPRYKHQAFVDADYMYVIGGGSFEPEGPDLDVYRLALVEGHGDGGGGGKALEWERLTPAGIPPRCRAAHGLAWDSVGRVAYIWGGFTSGMELDSTFCALRLSPPATLAPPTPPAAAATVATAEVTAVANATSGALDNAVPPISAVASFDIPPAAAAAAATAAEVVIDVSQDLGDWTVSGSYSGRTTTRRRNRRALSADAVGVMAAAVAAAVARNNKPLGSARGGRGSGRARGASASGTELAEQQQWRPQEEEQGQEHEHQEPQQEPQQDQGQGQQHSPPLSPRVEDARSSPGGVEGRERWRRRGQRLWRQGSGEERGGGGDEDQNSSGSSSGRSRRRRNLTWGQGWTAGRLQGLWGGGGSGDGGVESGSTNHAPSPPLPPPLPPVAVVAITADEAVLPPLPVLPDTAPSPDDTGAAAAPVVVREELSWVTLPSGQGGSAASTSGGDLPPAPSPAGRSFHCAFFHGGACYVTGGSDGARKFGDMWRFPARESPPPLTTLAARAFVASRGGNSAATMTTMATRKGGGGSGSGGDDGDARLLLQSLPEELREALENINMQAEVVL